MSPKQQVEELMASLLPVAERMLEEHGEFLPYGGYLDSDGKVVHVGTKIEGTNQPGPDALIDILRQNFRTLAGEKKNKATAVIFNVRILLPGTEEKSDAIQICLDHEVGDSAEVFFPYRLEEGKVSYGHAFAQRGSGLIYSAAGSA